MTSSERNGPPRQPEIDWQATLAQHGRWLRTVVLARVGEAAAVEDVMQEVSLAACDAGASLRDPARVAPWLYQLAVRQSLLYRRKLGRRRKLIERFAEHCPPQEHDGRTPDPLAWLLSEERRSLVRVALVQLPRRDAEILLLKYTEDWTYQQLAEHLGIGHSAVEARLHRARARLRTALARVEIAQVGQ